MRVAEPTAGGQRARSEFELVDSLFWDHCAVNIEAYSLTRAQDSNNLFLARLNIYFDLISGNGWCTCSDRGTISL